MHNAQFYKMTSREFKKKDILIDGKIDEDDLETYQRILHEEIFPPDDPYEVKEFCIDGNEKILMKVGS